MRRVQVNGVQAEALRTTVSPNIATANARQDTGAGKSAIQLAEALGVGAGLASMYRDQQDKEEQKRATDYANSVTVDELNKQLKEGKMLPSDNPIFMATLNHIHGDNLRSKLFRDTKAKMETGELDFSDPAAMDKYLTDARNGYLTGQSDFLIKGFDTQFAQMQDGLMNAQSQINARKAVEQATNDTTEFYISRIEELRSDGTLSMDDKTTRFATIRNTLNKTLVLPASERKKVFAQVGNYLAQKGDPELLQAILNSKDESGLKLETVIGQDTSRQLISMATQEHRRVQNKAVDENMLPFRGDASNGTLNEKKWREFYETNKDYITSAEYQSLVDRNNSAIISKRNQWLGMQKEVNKIQAQASGMRAVTGALEQMASRDGVVYVPEKTTVNGETFDTRKAFEQAALEQASQIPDITDRTGFLIRGNVDNPEWKSVLATGASSGDSIRFDVRNGATGEPSGTTVEAVKLYREIKAGSPDYAARMAGSNKDFYENTDMLMEFGFSEGEAVRTAINYRNMSQFDTEKRSAYLTAASTAVEEITDKWFSNTTMSIHTQGKLAKLAEVLSVGDGQNVDSIAANINTWLENNTVDVYGKTYFKADMPDFAELADAQGRQTNTQEDRMKVFQKAVAERYNLDYKPFFNKDPEDFDLVYRNGNYEVFLDGALVKTSNSQPFMYSRREIVDYVKTYEDSRARDIAAEANRRVRPTFRPDSDLTLSP